MTTQLLTTEYSYTAGNNFIKDLSQYNYYFFAGKSMPYAVSDSIVETPVESENYKNEAYRNILFGKKIANTDVSLVVLRNDWTPNTIFTQYDDLDSNLPSENFYAIVNAGAQYHLYKCLYNNANSVSIVQPDFSAVSLSDAYYQTSDGYIWKYMYTVPSATVTKFATTKYFPVGINTTIVNNAINGSISVIKVVNGGFNYNNYLAGLNKFGSNDLRLNGDGTLYNISANASASSVNNYYNGAYIYITSGPAGEVGQFRQIVNYYTNSTAKTIVLATAFTNAVSIASTYNIYPGVTVVGDGNETSVAVGRAVINAASNSVYKIEMLQNGSAYEVATANVVSYIGVGANNAVLRPIYSPAGGHGSNPTSELFAKSLVLSVSFANTEGNTILSTNDYRTIGILKSPVFANVDVQFLSKTGTFINGEKVYKTKPTLLGTNGTLSSTNNIYTNPNINLTLQFNSGDNILFSTGNAYMYATVNSVTNSSQLILTSNSSLSSNQISHYLPNISTTAIVQSSNATDVILNNVSDYILTGDLLFGLNSGSFMTANTTYISGVAKGFNTFVNAYKYSGNVISGVFLSDETVYQTSLTTANASLHSVVSNSVIYTTRNLGKININNNIVGSNSGAVALVTKSYLPELVFRSGKILYIENVSPILRQSTQTENFKLVFNY